MSALPILRSLAVACALPALTACTVTAVPPTEADENRARVLELEHEVDALRQRSAELEAALALARAAAEREDGAMVSSEALASGAFASTLALGRWSGPVDLDGDGRLELVRLYLEPRDGRGQLVEVVGDASAEVLLLDERGGSRVVGSLTLAPDTWRDAYRSGFMGRHYTLEIPVDLASAGSLEGASLVSRVSVRDALTGRTLATEAIRPAALVSSAP